MISTQASYSWILMPTTHHPSHPSTGGSYRIYQQLPPPFLYTPPVWEAPCILIPKWSLIEGLCTTCNPTLYKAKSACIPLNPSEKKLRWQSRLNLMGRITVITYPAILLYKTRIASCLFFLNKIVLKNAFCPFVLLCIDSDL